MIDRNTKSISIIYMIKFKSHCKPLLPKSCLNVYDANAKVNVII